MSDNACKCDVFNEGDWVECKLNSSVFGIVVGEADFGRYYHVMLAGSMETKTFFAVTLCHMDFGDDEPPAGVKTPPQDDDNVIDFTKERELRKTTTTRGAA